jgi:hypothetical protein
MKRELHLFPTTLLALVLCATPLVALLILTAFTAVNVPLVDDFDSVLNALNNYTEATSLSDKLSIIVAQHNEHRVGILRLVALIVVAICGSVRFDILALLGSVAVCCVPVAMLFLSSMRKDPSVSRTSFLVMISPIFFLLLQPQQHDTVLWATVSVANPLALLFALLSCSTLFSNARFSLALAMAFSLLASYSQGNGIVIFPAVGVVLLLRGEWRRVTLWSIAASSILALYFHGYHQVTGHPSIAASLLRVSDNLIYVALFIGAAGAAGVSLVGAGIGGSVILFSLFLTAKKFYRENPALYGALLFMFGTVLVNALARSGFGVEYAFSQTRYRFYSVVFYALMYLCALEVAKKLILKWAIAVIGVVLSICFSGISYYSHVQQVRDMSFNLGYGLLRWRVEGHGLLYPDLQRADAILKRSIALGLYTPVLQKQERFLFQPTVRAVGENTTLPLHYHIDDVREDPNYFFIRGWAFSPSIRTAKQKIRVMLRSNDTEWIFETRPSEQRADVAKAFNNPLRSSSGFEALISTRKLAPGSYQLLIEVSSDRRRAEVVTERRVEITATELKVL